MHAQVHFSPQCAEDAAEIPGSLVVKVSAPQKFKARMRQKGIFPAETKKDRCRQGI